MREIINGALARDQVDMSVAIPPYVSVSDFVRRAKDRASRKIQQEFEHIRKRHGGQRFWGQRFWGGRCFSAISGNITDDITMRCLDRHTHKDGFSPSPSSCRPWPVGHSEPANLTQTEPPIHACKGDRRPIVATGCI